MSHPYLQMSPNLNSNIITHAEQRKPEPGSKWAACLSGSAESQGIEKHAEHKHASPYTRSPSYINSNNLTSRGMNSGLRALCCQRTAASLRFVISPVGQQNWHISCAGWERVVGCAGDKLRTVCTATALA